VTANEITARLLIEIPKAHDCLVWRNNTGSGIGWGQVKAAIGKIKTALGCLSRGSIPAAIGALKQALLYLRRPMDFGLVGSADLLLVAPPGGRLLGLEVKDPDTGDEQSPGQIAWQKRIEALGGGYLLVSSVEQGLRDLKEILK
jgi:hypothetical protein